MQLVRVCLVVDGDGWRVRPVDESGAPTGPARLGPGAVPADAVAADRVVWAETAAGYPALRARGVRVARCHDVALAEGLLLGHEGRWGAPRSLTAAWARLTGAPVPP